MRPDLYGLVKPVAATSPPLRAARWIVLGSALALALQLLLALKGRLRSGAVLSGLLAVALVGAVVGLVRTRADYTPVARGRFEISYYAGGVERRRTYLVYRHAGPGASAPRPPDALPVLFGGNRAPWWRGVGEEVFLEEGITRIFLVEEIVQASMIKERQRYERSLSYLGTVGSNAPFIGLLGTVIGVIIAFAELGRNPKGGLEVVGPGISEALVATAVGLVVAIPSLMCFNWMKGLLKKRLANSDFLARIIVTQLKRKTQPVLQGEYADDAEKDAEGSALLPAPAGAE